LSTSQKKQIGFQKKTKHRQHASNQVMFAAAKEKDQAKGLGQNCFESMIQTEGMSELG